MRKSSVIEYVELDDVLRCLSETQLLQELERRCILDRGHEIFQKLRVEIAICSWIKNSVCRRMESASIDARFVLCTTCVVVCTRFVLQLTLVHVTDVHFVVCVCLFGT